jgi:integrase
MGRARQVTGGKSLRAVYVSREQTGSHTGLGSNPFKGKPAEKPTTSKPMAEVAGASMKKAAKQAANTNPLEEMVAPAAKGDPVHNRRPMKIAEFAKLMSFLRTAAPKYPHQQLSWTPEDRLMIYWMAVKTGFRSNELRSLTRASVDFDADPVLVTVEGWVAKSRTKATVPITDDEFVNALRAYSLHRLPNAALLRMPSQYCLTEGLYRDLDAAGVRREFDNGAVVDFHTLRSTAICWWLKEGLDLLEVQHRSRLKTLSLVQEYVRNYVPEYLELVRKSPKGGDENLPALRVS